MPGSGEAIWPRRSNWIAVGEFGRVTGRENVDKEWSGGQGNAGGIVDEPQHSSRTRAMGASRSLRLHRAERQLERLSERTSGPAVRSVPLDQLATVLGVFWRERHGKYGASDRMDHERARSATAGGRF